MQAVGKPVAKPEGAGEEKKIVDEQQKMRPIMTAADQENIS